MAPEQTALKRWLESRRPEWVALEKEERELAAASLDLERAATLAAGYRRLAADVAAARTALPGSALAAQLEGLYRRLHLQLNRPFEPLRRRLARLYLEEVPQATRSILPQLQAVVTLFLAAGVVGWLLVASFPELAALFASEPMIEGLARGELWTDRVFGVAPPAVLSANIAANNIMVTLFAWGLGLFYGLGTLYIIGLNGLMLGGIIALVAQHDLLPGLLRFIGAHGPAELSVICIAGACGLRLGEVLARPGQRPRAEAFRAAVAETTRLLAVLIPALIVCGLVEGHVSPDPGVADWVRAVYGLGCFTLLWAAMFGRIRRGGARAARGSD